MSDLIDRFWTAFERDPERLRIPRMPDIPGEMVSDERLPPPWVRWKVVPGRTSKKAFRDWEQDRGLNLPDSFRDWFLSRHTLQVDCGFLRLAASPSNKPFGDLEELLEWDVEQFRTKVLFPIGDEALFNAGPLCLDLREKGDPPVVYWDAESDAPSERVFSSFGKLLELAAFAMEQETGIFEDDEVMEQFLRRDPGGAGGPGRAYWKGDED